MKRTLYLMLAIMLIASFTLVAMPQTAIAATTIYVDDDTCPSTGSGTIGDPYCSIQTAISNASAGDTIQVAAGTYYEYNILWDDKDLVIQGDGASTTIIDADGEGRIFTTKDLTEDSILQGFTITGGNSVSGGGMKNDDSNLYVINCIFFDNQCNNNGGGMYNYNEADPTVINCTFWGNAAGDDDPSDYGGGMHNTGNCTPIVTNCIFWDNDAVGDAYDPICPSDLNPTDGDDLVTYCNIEGGYDEDDGDTIIDADPKFVSTDEDEEDFHLLSISTGIDRGTSVDVDYDFEGDDREIFNAVDMGVDEVDGVLITATSDIDDNIDAWVDYDMTVKFYSSDGWDDINEEFDEEESEYTFNDLPSVFVGPGHSCFSLIINALH